MDAAFLTTLLDGIPPSSDLDTDCTLHTKPLALRTPHIWRQLFSSVPAEAPPIPDSANAGAASLLVRHIESTYTDRDTQMRILEAATSALRMDAADVEHVSTQLADLLGFDQLDLVMALCAKPDASGAQLERILRHREHGVGSSQAPLALAPAQHTETYPHVYAAPEQNNILTAGGARFSLPLGTMRTHENLYEEVTIPPSNPLPFRSTERLLPISEMDLVCRGAFRHYKTLNRLQSAVYPMAYQTNENLLICAPTGAGKTDVAMLSVLRCISRYATVDGTQIHINKDAFKIVYVAPMKALVSEIVSKFSKRLAYLGIKVRELTGDMQLSRREIAETQMVVTTPEKWDVVTRRPTGEGELALSVRLLIIDEVHLLHEDRGAVIETIVARTQRLVESTQSMIRIVGLSATLPNYVDVADFLGVNRYRGLFYFGSAFRPVPLEQHFLGVRGKAGSTIARANLDRVAYEKVQQLVEAGHQVMVFVHTRKDTVKSAESLLELGKDDGLEAMLTEQCTENTVLQRNVAMSRNREMRELFAHGIGIHNAGMLRSDRDLAERAFAEGATRILFSTATLAWGVNLPAYAVIIKGTDVYNADVSKFVDLGILDVLQIFGRAGRPQYEDKGVGYICTNIDKLPHYIESVTASHPIESTFLQGIVDALNAEIALGSVASITEGVSWLGFTYLFTRLKKAPLVYGISLQDLAADPTLATRRAYWISNAAKVLTKHGMVVHDTTSGRLYPTNIGRIASRYYIGHRTVEVFQQRLRNNLREADALDLMSRAVDFGQVTYRESEETELRRLLDSVPCQVAGGARTALGKVNILLQAFVSNLFIEDFALVSDGRYVSQNAGRVLLSLVDMALERGYATAAFAFLNLAKAVDRRMWPFEHPLKQMQLKAEVKHKVLTFADDLEVGQLRAMPLPALGTLLRANQAIAEVVHNAAMRFPQVQLAVRTYPLPDAHVRLDIGLRRDFVWDEKVHGSTLPILLWVEDATQRVVYTERLILRNTTQALGNPSTPDIRVSIHVALHDPATRPASQEMYTVVWASQHWLGADGAVELDMNDVWCPEPSASTRLLPLPLLHVKDAVKYAEEYTCDGIHAFNLVQTQVFHTLAHSARNVLLCAPPGAGKKTVIEMAICRALDLNETVLVLAPHDAAARQYTAQLSRRAWTAGKLIGKGAAIQVVTPATLSSPSTALCILLDMHCMDATYELAVIQILRNAPRRIVASSASLASAECVASWLGIAPRHVYNYAPEDRPYPVSLTMDTVDIPYSDTQVRGYIKPAYERVRAAPGPAILITPLRNQSWIAANELLARMATDPEALATPLQDPEAIAARAQRTDLAHLLRQGIGVWHKGLGAQDCRLVEELYEMGLVRILLISRDAVPLLTMRAGLVGVLGTEYMQTSGVGTGLEHYSLPVLLEMQALAVRPAETRGAFAVMCHQTRAATLQRLLCAPYALESKLDASALLAPLLLEIQAQRVKTMEDACAWLSASFFARRALANPGYYQIAAPVHGATRTEAAAAVSAVLDETAQLAAHMGLIVCKDKAMHLTRLGTGALAHDVENWHALMVSGIDRYSVSDDIAHRLSTFAAPTSEENDVLLQVLKRSIPKPILDAVKFESLPALLLACWLADTRRGGPRASMEILVRDLGAKNAAQAAQLRDALLVHLSRSRRAGRE
ncbi:RNA helicase [Malassezia vespertilionis]|uniref:Uncharacterized protein n=1 Tax=Malassezia vespertilionis TaxID=2020962 RepID=A0A2N1JBR5_9BASI|nr:RNA helicase [Malassezia vespertilionis]PKI83976.1 hypothetical protein MVES_002070 [Malassezia vespertilionis]WFD06840.1 RNA helicase [Malassezia vespertilionis]